MVLFKWYQVFILNTITENIKKTSFKLKFQMFLDYKLDITFIDFLRNCIPYE